MPTKRVPIHRDFRRGQVTQEWAAKFSRVCALAPQRLKCIRSQFCLSTDPSRHCRDCLEQMRLIGELRAHFLIPPWETFRDDYEPPKLPAAELSDWWISALTNALDDRDGPGRR